MTTQDQIRDALRLVIDPELGLNVVDLGLIYNIELDDDAIDVTMTLTTAGCPLHESMAEAVRHVVQMVDLTKQVHVNLVWEPAWTPERMKDSARAALGWQ